MMTFDDYIRRIMEQDNEILKNLGPAFYEEGIPYWEKWHKGQEAQFDAEYPIDKTQH